MNWDNKDKDPWGNKNDAPDFDELMKKFSSILGRKKTNSSGSHTVDRHCHNHRCIQKQYRIYSHRSI